MTAINILSEQLAQVETAQKVEEPPKVEDSRSSEESHHTQKTSSSITIDLAAQDVRDVMEQQKQQSHLLTTKLNILFVVNGALLTSLTISRLIFFLSPFSIGEIIGFLMNFTLLINAFLPRQVAVSPNLEDKKFLERYLSLTPEEYQLRMMANQIATYNTNKQRLDDVSQSLTYSAYVTWVIALLMFLHMISSYFVSAT
ncbi:hypothetical protein [Gloeothece verrucosa]|uniref:Uncharacterized protein n=1 Tax=Gloeothece verrucosa (strain PCC 7822) TaxID=497965 RepID=E0UBL6_GLOV7|nr:hypothetical protein [Gloeothece verrucosa]ADN13960.1 hypothetical protein Cyan7822_1978 [Gloeothece verrucosa PCC 7822]